MDICIGQVFSATSWARNTFFHKNLSWECPVKTIKPMRWSCCRSHWSCLQLPKVLRLHQKEGLPPRLSRRRPCPFCTLRSWSLAPACMPGFTYASSRNGAPIGLMTGLWWSPTARTSPSPAPQRSMAHPPTSKASNTMLRLWCKGLGQLSWWEP